MNGHFEIAKYLILNGCDPNHCDSSGNSIAHYAAAYGWIDCLKLLHIAGADLNTLNAWKTSPLSITMQKGHLKCAQYLLSDKSVDVNFLDIDGRTMLHHQLMKKSAYTYQIVKLLIEKNAKVSQPDLYGTTALHLLSKSPKQSDKEIAELLVHKGADVNAVDSENYTPLMHAISFANIPMIKFLIEKGANLFEKTINNENILHLLAKKINNYDLLEIFDIISKKIDSNQWNKLTDQANDDGFTPLLMVCIIIYLY